LKIKRNKFSNKSIIENNKKRIKINEKKLLNKNKSESVSSISSLSSSLLKLIYEKKQINQLNIN
jgi:hypothetical protein